MERVNYIQSHKKHGEGKLYSKPQETYGFKDTIERVNYIQSHKKHTDSKTDRDANTEASGFKMIEKMGIPQLKSQKYVSKALL